MFQKTIANSNKKALGAIIVYTLVRFAYNRYDSIVYKAKLTRNFYIDCNLVASWADDTPFKQNYINKNFHKFITAHNITIGENLLVYRIHDLRHMAATLLCRFQSCQPWITSCQNRQKS